MSALPHTVRVHQALAKCHPLSMDSRQLCAVLDMQPSQVRRALAHCVSADVVRRVRAVGVRKGYGYTLVTE
jgi:DNA-binding IclR family transcriptional regulator